MNRSGPLIWECSSPIQSQALSDLLLVLLFFEYRPQWILLEYFVEWCKVSSGIIVAR